MTRLVAEQLTAFRERFGPADRRRARALHVTSYELLTVASMVEREAQTAHDRPLIAAVIYNRLRHGHAAGDRRHDLLRGRAAEGGRAYRGNSAKRS